MTKGQGESSQEQEAESLSTVRARTVSFYGDELVAVQAVDNSIYVPIRRLCENLKLNRVGQVQRIKRNDVLSEGLRVLIIESEASRDNLSLRADLIPLWLAGVSTARIKDVASRDKLVLYQRDCARILWQEFASSLPSDMLNPGTSQAGQTELLTTPRNDSATLVATTSVDLDSNDLRAYDPEDDSEKIQFLVQLRENTLAVANLIDEQIAIQKRLKKAALVVRGILLKMDDHEDRLSRLELRLDPGNYITSEQATEVSMKVKALAEELTRQSPSGGVHYNAVFTELYRRFTTSSYKQIRLGQYHEVLEFLDDWQKSIAQ